MGSSASIVNTNMLAQNAQRNLNIQGAKQAKSVEKLSSGLRINRASDDAAGLAVSEKMRSQMRGLSQASTNAQDAISMMQTTEGALTEVHDMLQRMRELTVQAGNDTYCAGDVTKVKEELSQLSSELDSIASKTSFNKTKSLETAATRTFQVGANESETSSFGFSALSTLVSDAKAVSNVSTTSNARETISKIDQSIQDVSKYRAQLGAFQNRLEHTVNNLDVSNENITAAESRIRDTDMAKEMAKYSSVNVLAQAANSMLAQANSNPQNVLSLLR
jgi:flagellin